MGHPPCSVVVHSFLKFKPSTGVGKALQMGICCLPLQCQRCHWGLSLHSGSDVLYRSGCYSYRCCTYVVSLCSFLAASFLWPLESWLVSPQGGGSHKAAEDEPLRFCLTYSGLSFPSACRFVRLRMKGWVQVQS